MTRTPVILGLAAMLAASLMLSACKARPTVDDSTPQSATDLQMVNGVFMRVNELPTKAETRNSAEFETIRHRVIDQQGETRHD